ITPKGFCVFRPPRKGTRTTHYSSQLDSWLFLWITHQATIRIRESDSTLSLFLITSYSFQNSIFSAN
ncbi:hypothetical protein, partial [Algoriphagus halophilus]|uniref:hypothetical protein n=1 Tax=Algoriphagus halophilus TaxID=226505 RepID=UPI001F169A54